MSRRLFASFLLFLLAAASVHAAYDSITPAALRDRLVAHDTLLILDVRGWGEYTGGHIAEPAGQLPLTPACMPWPGTLKANYAKLPRNIDIIVNCQRGNRSASASHFLDSIGFTRIFNMTGGFLAWSGLNNEQRTGGFGDHSGRWIRSTATSADTVRHDSCAIVFPAHAISGRDSLYCEIHFAYGKQPVPGDAPVSGIAGLFRVTALDEFGLPAFSGDSLVLSNAAAVTLFPRPKTGATLPPLVQTGVTALVSPGVWKPLAFSYQSAEFLGAEHVLRRWYNAAGSLQLMVRKQPGAKTNGLTADICGGPAAYGNLLGRRITGNSRANAVSPATPSGYYIIGTPRERQTGTVAIRRR